jgi:hypothetical protein
MMIQPWSEALYICFEGSDIIKAWHETHVVTTVDVFDCGDLLPVGCPSLAPENNNGIIWYLRWHRTACSGTEGCRKPKKCPFDSSFPLLYLLCFLRHLDIRFISPELLEEVGEDSGLHHSKMMGLLLPYNNRWHEACDMGKGLFLMQL